MSLCVEEEGVCSLHGELCYYLILAETSCRLLGRLVFKHALTSPRVSRGASLGNSLTRNIMTDTLAIYILMQAPYSGGAGTVNSVCPVVPPSTFAVEVSLSASGKCKKNSGKRDCCSHDAVDKSRDPALLLKRVKHFDVEWDNFRQHLIIRSFCFMFNFSSAL